MRRQALLNLPTRPDKSHAGRATAHISQHTARPQPAPVLTAQPLGSRQGGLRSRAPERWMFGGKPNARRCKSAPTWSPRRRATAPQKFRQCWDAGDAGKHGLFVGALWRRSQNGPALRGAESRRVLARGRKAAGAAPPTQHTSTCVQSPDPTSSRRCDRRASSPRLLCGRLLWRLCHCAGTAGGRPVREVAAPPQPAAHALLAPLLCPMQTPASGLRLRSAPRGERRTSHAAAAKEERPAGCGTLAAEGGRGRNGDAAHAAASPDCPYLPGLETTR
eukprot:364664-Chlamydomonas_euryale.AAC.19